MTDFLNPEVGQGATYLMYTDRKAFTIIEVRRNGREIVLQQDKVTRIDNHEMSESQAYDFAPDPNGKIVVATRRKNGGFGVKDHKYADIVLGTRDYYHDYSF